VVRGKFHARRRRSFHQSARNTAVGPARGSGDSNRALLLLYRTPRSFHDFVLSADVALLTATQSWRFAGVGFIALNLLGFLPGYFAWPAGLGDMAIAITAPWVALALARDLANRKIFIAWNLFGIFDFAVLAVGMGAIAPLIFPNLLHTVTPQMVTAAPMRHLPLSLVPSFLVPMFTTFHLVGLFQTSRARAPKSARPSSRSAT
jgi:hypothetical protein